VYHTVRLVIFADSIDIAFEILLQKVKPVSKPLSQPASQPNRQTAKQTDSDKIALLTALFFFSKI